MTRESDSDEGPEAVLSPEAAQEAAKAAAAEAAAHHAGGKNKPLVLTYLVQPPSLDIASAISTYVFGVFKNAWGCYSRPFSEMNLPFRSWHHGWVFLGRK